MLNLDDINEHGHTVEMYYKGQKTTYHMTTLNIPSTWIFFTAPAGMKMGQLASQHQIS